jgi:hydroxylamine dehydrogenase
LRAQGASMSGPDYAWWHGIYEVAKTFYLKNEPPK